MIDSRRARASADSDDGRTAVYAAEIAAFGGTDLEDVVGLPRATQVVAIVTGTAWWPGPDVRTSGTRRDAGSSSCVALDGTSPGGAVEIRLAAPQTTVATVAHELAHALAGPEHGHDAVFRRAYLDVVIVATNIDPTDRRGRLHVAQLSDALRTAGLDVGERGWPPPPRALGGAIAL